MKLVELTRSAWSDGDRGHDSMRAVINPDRVVLITENRNGTRLILSGCRHAIDVDESITDVIERLKNE